MMTMTIDQVIMVTQLVSERFRHDDVDDDDKDSDDDDNLMACYS